MPREIKVRGVLELDGSGWDKTLRHASEETQKWGREGLGELKGQIAAAFSIAAIGEFVKSVFEMGKNIHTLGEQFDLTAEEVQKLQITAIKSGLEFDNFGRALIKIGQARREAAEKNDELLKSFEKFGVTLADLENPQVRSIDLLTKMGEAIQKMNLSPRDRLALDDLLGSKGGERLAASLTRINDIGGIKLVSDKEVKKLDEATQKMELFWLRLKQSVASEITGETNEKQAIGLANILGIPLRETNGERLDEYRQHKAQIRQQHPSQTIHDSAPQQLFDNKRFIGPPVPPGFGKEPPHELHSKSDALLRVGNFLGSGHDNIANIAHKTNQHLQNIHGTLKLIHTAISKSGSTSFPH